MFYTEFHNTTIDGIIICFFLWALVFLHLFLYILPRATSVPLITFSVERVDNLVTCHLRSGHSNINIFFTSGRRSVINK